ncbi:MAG: helix-turn-helix domain-containing protein [Sulfolobales archaeon]
MGFRSYLVYMEVDHGGCWTELTRSRDIYARNLRKDLSYTPDSYKATSIFIGEDIGVFINDFRSYKKMLRMRVNSYSRGYAILDYEIVKRDTIAEMLGRSPNIIVLGFDILDGVERWRLLVTRSNRDAVGSIREEVGRMGNILKFQVMEPDLEKIVEQYPMLSKYEVEALAYAYAMGYIDYPRRARARDIARILGISPATFLYHLRRAEKKLVASYLKKNHLRYPYTSRSNGIDISGES